MCPTPLKKAKYLFSPQKRGSSFHSPPARRRTSLECELSSALNPGSQIKSQQGDLLTAAPLQVLPPRLIHTVTDRLPSAPTLHPKGKFLRASAHLLVTFPFTQPAESNQAEISLSHIISSSALRHSHCPTQAEKKDFRQGPQD
ncbi:hypothetical protein Q8A67_019811 [Cirrhinus molitorella]|uniref:Uncharacterized protein n=1 Tax=Cirrhinus molitorella TaxID=172907 RepID=A0AA88PF53_9TELE|nr:hypothetical protein Q8A67_019811 [Cirrhinus molitorella]